MASMKIEEWVTKTDLSSPITGLAVLIFGRDDVSGAKAVGSGVFVADRLIMTVKHVIKEHWRFYGNPRVELERQGKKIAESGIFAVQVPGTDVEPALWAARKISLCPYSDLALMSVEPVDELAKAQPPFGPLPLNILPPMTGEKIQAFGYASTSTVTEEGLQVKFHLNPSSTAGVVTEVYPERRDSAMLSFPSFAIQAHFIGGMSGGPVINAAGELSGLICSGYDEAPIAYGVVLWPMTGITIDHPIPGAITQEPYTILEMARAGLMNVAGRRHVEANVEAYEDLDGTKRVRLKAVT